MFKENSTPDKAINIRYKVVDIQNHTRTSRKNKMIILDIVPIALNIFIS